MSTPDDNMPDLLSVFDDKAFASEMRAQEINLTVLLRRIQWLHRAADIGRIVSGVQDPKEALSDGVNAILRCAMTLTEQDEGNDIMEMIRLLVLATLRASIAAERSIKYRIDPASDTEDLSEGIDL